MLVGRRPEGPCPAHTDQWEVMEVADPVDAPHSPETWCPECVREASEAGFRVFASLGTLS